MKNIYAYTGGTPPGGYYPTYISVNESQGQPHSIDVSVRSADAIGAGITTLTLAQAAELAEKLRAYVDSQLSVGASFNINSVPYVIDTSPLVMSYEDICLKANKNPDHNPSCMASTKTGGKILSRGDYITITAGMHITCMATGNA